MSNRDACVVSGKPPAVVYSYGGKPPNPRPRFARLNIYYHQGLFERSEARGVGVYPIKALTAAARRTRFSIPGAFLLCPQES